METKKTTRGKLREEELAYIAGFIDGDGSIVISKSKNPRNPELPRYSLVVTAMGIHEGIMRWLKESFDGGGVHTKSTRHGASCYLPHHKVQWRWEITGNNAVRVLEQIVPYLKIKKEQAELGIRFQNKKNAECGNYRTRPVPKEYIVEREKMYQKMKSLKDIGETLQSYRSRND